MLGPVLGLCPVLGCTQLPSVPAFIPTAQPPTPGRPAPPLLPLKGFLGEKGQTCLHLPPPPPSPESQALGVEGLLCAGHHLPCVPTPSFWWVGGRALYL